MIIIMSETTCQFIRSEVSMTPNYISTATFVRTYDSYRDSLYVCRFLLCQICTKRKMEVRFSLVILQRDPECSLFERERGPRGRVLLKCESEVSFVHGFLR